MTTDVGEKNDLSQLLQDLARDISAQWAAWRKQMDDAEPRGPFRDY
jgi:hypothetical protein